VNKVGHTVNQRRVSNQMTRDLFPFPVSTFGGRSSPFGKHQYPEMLGMQYSFSSNVGKLHCLLTHTKECCQGLQKKIEAQSTNQYYLRARSEHCSWLYSWHDCRRLVDSDYSCHFPSYVPRAVFLWTTLLHGAPNLCIGRGKSFLAFSYLLVTHRSFYQHSPKMDTCIESHSEVCIGDSIGRFRSSVESPYVFYDALERSTPSITWALTAVHMQSSPSHLPHYIPGYYLHS
jgi:hypothetical protein